MKKVLIALAVSVVLIVVFLFWFIYEGFDTVDAQLSEVKPGEVINESYYLTETVDEDGNTVKTYPLDTTHGLTPHSLVIGEGTTMGKEGVFAKMSGSVFFTDQPYLALVDGSDIHNGIIEIEVNGTVGENVSPFSKLAARGFIGVGFRIQDDLSAYEGLYIRPDNGPTDDPVRKNHATQYVSFPDWEFDRFREEAPEQYESAAPVALGEWEKLKIEVEGEVAKLYVDDGAEPVLVVNDLKMGPDARGKVGLWVCCGTHGFFRNLKVTKFD